NVMRRTVQQLGVGHQGRGLRQPRWVPEAGDFPPRLVARAGAAIEAIEARRREEKRLHSVLDIWLSRDPGPHGSTYGFFAARTFASNSSRWVESPLSQAPPPLFWKADLAPTSPVLIAALASARWPLPMEAPVKAL